MTETVWLVVGLGNPGAHYAGNRHNVGQMVLDVLAGRAGARFAAHKTRAVAAAARIGLGPGGGPGARAILAKPLSYMNLSGGPVAGLAKYFRIEASDVVVVHDDVDLPYGTVRLKRGGGEGGHNGLRDITKALGTRDYLRVRAGVGRPPGQMDTADYVLRNFSGDEVKELPLLLDDAADAVEMLLTRGLLAAQDVFHARAPRA